MVPKSYEVEWALCVIKEGLELGVAEDGFGDPGGRTDPCSTEGSERPVGLFFRGSAGVYLAMAKACWAARLMSSLARASRKCGSLWSAP